jgi:hypothetical protein
MEEYSYGFDKLDLQIFELVDKSLEQNDYKYQAEIINEMFNRKMLCDFEIIRAVSIISSIVCNLEEDVIYASDGFPIDNCIVMNFSDKLDDMFLAGLSNDEIFDFVKNELLVRERYELLNELKKYKKNG